MLPGARLGFPGHLSASARAIHFEGATAGTDLELGIKKFQVTNRAKFVDRHVEALAHQYPARSTSVHTASSRRPGIRILVADVTVPRWDWDAGSLRLRRLIDILGDLGHRVTLLPEDKAGAQPYTEVLQSLGVEVLHGDYDHQALLKARRGEFQLAILCRAPTAARYWQMLEAAGNRPPILFDTVDLHYLRLERRAAIDQDPALDKVAAEMRKIELALAARADRVWVVTRAEQLLLEETTGIKNVGVVPTIHLAGKDGLPFEERHGLLFVGGFLHEPNVDAVTYFTREVFPLIQLQLPEVDLLIAGSNPPPAVWDLQDDHIKVLGWVEALEPLLGRVRVHIAPIRFGAGMRGKIGEAMAVGLPTVTTVLGAEGMGLKDEFSALIANSSEEFAAKVAQIYNDETLWTKVADQGRRHAELHYGYGAVRDTVKTELEILQLPVIRATKGLP